MPWCPNCKNEYREGVLKCADCGADLVAELAPEDDSFILCYLPHTLVADKLVSYLKYSGIDSKSEFDPHESAFKVTVSEADRKKALVEYKAFLTVENSQAAEKMKALSGEDEESDESGLSIEVEEGEDGEARRMLKVNSLEDLQRLKDSNMSPEEKQALLSSISVNSSYKPAGVYQSQSEKANDYYSTGYTFLIIGILIFIFTALNLFGVLKFFYQNYMTIVILFALSLAACGVGIGAFKRSKKASSGIQAEEQLTAKINEWMEKHKNIMTDGSLSGDDGTPDEILYLKRTQAMKQSLTSIFGELDEDYVDSLIDDFYNKEF